MRPFCIATIGTILGIIMGLYLQSIALLVLLLILTIFLTIMISILNCIQIKKYIKSICIFCICFLSFYGYTYFLEKNYQEINQAYDKKEIEFKAIVVSDKIEKEYKDAYKIQVTEAKEIETIIENEEKNNKKTKNKDTNNNINEKEEYREKLIYDKNELKNQKFKMILNVKKDKNSKLKLQYGDEISFIATYEEPSTARNDGGFDYQQYLKTNKIVGIASVKPEKIEIMEKNKTSLINKTIHEIKESAVTKIKTALTTDTANLCTGLLLGEKEELSEDIQEDFRNSNLSHMLAISGAHVSYILLGITTIVQKLKFHKRWSKIFLITFLIFFMALVGFTPSVTRACIMAILQLLASILFKKSDTYQNLAISSFIIFFVNPYALLDIGFQLSFVGTIGIVIFSKILIKNTDTKNLKNKYRSKEQMYIEKKEEDNDKYAQLKKQGKQSRRVNKDKKNNKLLCINIAIQKLIRTIKEMCIVTISANILIIPIIMYHFNSISFTFLISNLLASPILGVSLIFSMIFFITLFICYPMAKLISFFLQPVLQLLIWIARFSSKLPFSQILVPTPSLWQILLYYLTLALFFANPKRKNLDKNNLESYITQNIGTIQNAEIKQDEKLKLYQLTEIKQNNQSKLNQLIKHKNVILIIIIFLIISPYILQIFPRNKLTINFIDVGQGDSMLIQTPSRKTILIDGGGSETGSFDVGEKTLLPYLLDKGILKIDYMMFSHFDSDHCQGLFTVMEKLKVKNAIVSKQGEESENYKRFLEIATKRKVNVIVVQAENKIQIDKQCALNILFPEQELITTNVLNNNSIVAKLLYQTKTMQKFSLLLTGDVEEIAENKLVEEYQGTNDLQATILKVAHHRF